MKIRELLEAKYDYPLSDYEDTPYDPGFEFVGQDREANKVYNEPHIGPQEGKYLNLMLRGIKPATVIAYQAQKRLFQPYIKDGTVIVAAKDKDEKDGDENWYLTLPGEEWRGKKLQELFNKLWAMRDRPDFSVDQEKVLDAKIGRLLGLPKESVRYFLKTRY
jgi:hypothetical protein